MTEELIDYKSVREQADEDGPLNWEVVMAWTDARLANDHEEEQRLHKMVLFTAKCLRVIKRTSGADHIIEQEYRTDLADLEYGPDWLDRPCPSFRAMIAEDCVRQVLDAKLWHQAASNPGIDDALSSMPKLPSDAKYSLINFTKVRKQADDSGPMNDDVSVAWAHALYARCQADEERLRKMMMLSPHSLMAIKREIGSDRIRELGLRTDLADAKYGPDWLDRPCPSREEILAEAAVRRERRAAQLRRPTANPAISQRGPAPARP